MAYLTDIAGLHNYYSSQTSSIYKSTGTEFAADLDSFARTLICGLWRCHKLSEEHTDALNEIYSKGQPRPTYLYWELVSAATSGKPIAVPDFFRARAILDRTLAQSVCRDISDFLRALLLRLCSTELLSEETEYISSVNKLLCSAVSCENVLLFDETVLPTGGQPAPVQLHSEAKPSSAASKVQEKAAEPAESVEDLLAELDELVGMEQIKKDVRSLINLIKVRKLRQENGLAVPDLSLHMVFTGNPGTGKTTVARLLARLYRAIGVLEKGTLVEVDRSALVAGYVGQTALKTREALDKAIGGILFIDEAYSLAPEGGSSNDFGHEAIETILKVMEDERDELVVIAAGYPEPMERFISSNPGLESRFGKYFHFEDYNGEQLFEIFKSQCKKNQYEPDEAAAEYAQKLFTELYENRDENFGNARDVRNIFEKAVARHSDRVAAMEAPTREDLLTLIEADLYPEAE
ncbi:MAG: AAA family ATPase [Oscillospiraceae bacterium]|nr:AAA family ATPase [Oscillospiraceae bacterium]